MDRPPATMDAKAVALSDERSPQRLLREAASLAAILMAVLLVSIGELNAPVAVQGYLSSLTLLILCGLHMRLFRVVVPLRSVRPKGAWFPVLYALGLLATMVVAAGVPFAPETEGPLPLSQAIHIVLLVPISEELYFRGLLLEHLRRGMATWRAVAFCSLLFGLLHLSSDAFLPTFLLSLAACGLVILTGGLEYAIALHAAWNAFTVIVCFVAPEFRWIWAATASVTILATILVCRRAARTVRRP